MRIIELTQGIGCMVDDEDFDRLNTYNWHAARRGRQWVASRNIQIPGNINQTTVNMHREIVSVLAGQEVDHIEHHEFWIDNRKSNLRAATRPENMHNMRKPLRGNRYKGVSWRTPHCLWRAYISLDKVQYHLGYYESETDAAHVYDYAAKIYFGEFARLNFPE